MTLRLPGLPVEMGCEWSADWLKYDWRRHL